MRQTPPAPRGVMSRREPSVDLAVVVIHLYMLQYFQCKHVGGACTDFLLGDTRIQIPTHQRAGHVC